MAIMSGQDYFNLARNFRVVWIGGRFGGGKSALASFTAAEFLRFGWAGRVVSNYPLAVQTFPPPEPLKNAVAIIDEASAFLTKWADAEEYVRALRKYDLTLLMPAVYPPHARLRGLKVSRIFNAYIAGIPMWVYKWFLRSDVGIESGTFFWWRPIQDIQGLYATGYNPSSDWGIQAAIAANETRKRTTKNADALARAQQKRDASADMGLETLQDAGEAFGQAADKIANVARRLRR